MTELKDLLSLVKSPSKEDIALITKAYTFAEKAHTGQKRFSGDPYFVHVFETAKNLAELGSGAVVIAAGLLHDCIEDAGVTPETLEKEFGKEIGFLVDGVTKLGQLKYRGLQRHSESLRKLFVAMSQDIRVILIKLADRLHNMQTLQFVPKEKQERIAAETLEIYAQVAYRLGIRKLNRELEDLSFPYVSPREYQEVKKLFNEKHKEDLKHLEKFNKSLMKALAKEGLTNIKIDYRIKGLYSFYKKLLRKNNDIDKIYDVSALRLTVPSISDCYKALGIIHGIWRPLPGRIKDYIAFPKTNGYQSIHTTIFTGDGGIVEIQIKTEEMYRESEFGIASHVFYKEYLKRKSAIPSFAWILSLLPFKGDPQVKTNLETPIVKKINLEDVPHWVKDLVDYHDTLNEQDDFIENLKSDFLKERMFVFTPKGDVIDLPTGSNPIDFAYAIHSDIGNHISGVKVNRKQVSLDTVLKNGDTVEIQTKESSHPTDKWLTYAKTAVAHKHIRAALDKLKESPNTFKL
jgi:guanosine-3',5'-bis(diphosphate) 3'-pyrophosphohydrolase